ncbi:MAG: hypothetical protein HY595_02210 [Candidatus Omnitrophica bacterium]|nr:hypothetical protein [Candidatus Omnitrophota bacterium]
MVPWAVGLAWLSLSPIASAQSPASIRFDERTQVALQEKKAFVEYTFSVDQAGYVIARFDAIPSGMGPMVAYYAGDQELQAKWDSFGIRVDPGSYRVRVRDRSEYSASPEPMTFWLEFHPETDASEPNDDPTHARPITLGTPVIFQVLPKRDVDAVTFSVETPGYLYGEFQYPGLLLPVLEVLNEVGQVTGTLSHRSSLRLPQGTMTARLRSSVDDWSTEPVTLSTWFLPEPDPSEPNDTIAAARQVELDEPIRLWMLPAGDRDVLRVEAPASGYLWVKREYVPSPLMLVAEWLSAEGAALDSKRWFRQVSKGTALVRIRDEFDLSDKCSLQPVQLSVRFLPAPDGDQPNDRFETARPVELNRLIRAHLIPEGDADFFRFEVDHPGLVTAQVVVAPSWLRDFAEDPIHDYQLELFDAQHAPITGSYRSGYTTAAALAPGTYFLKVSRYEKDSTGFEPLVIRLALTELAVPMPGVELTLIGLGVQEEPGTVRQLQMIAEGAGGRFVAVEELEGLKREMASALAGRNRGTLWSIVVIMVLVALAGGWAAKRGFSPKARR